ncbi:MAG: efflux RND transporter periplasmic adaptor subunit [Planctomycetes bacterium]|nr:efflux RND transporter periplasmic adaptor subunit [Planctomycetota bacterium]
MTMKVLKIVGVLLGLLIVAGIGLSLLGALAVRGGPAAAWKTENVDRGELAVTVTATGSIEPLSSVKVGSRVSGNLMEVLVEPDAAVTKGQVLARLDTELLEVERRDREIALEHARSAVTLLKVEAQNLELRKSQIEMDRARQEVAIERAQAQLELAKKNLARYREMQTVDAASETDVEIRALEHGNAERDLRLAKLQLDGLKLDLEKLATDRQSLAARARQAELDQAQNEQALAKAEANLRYASIAAPCDGVVLERKVEPGQTIAASFQAPELFTIVSDLRRVRVTVKLDEAEVGRIVPGQKVSFEVDAFRGRSFEGEVKAVRLQHELRGSLVTYPVLIEAENPPDAGFPHGRLRPGLTAYVTFHVEHKTDIERLPAAALRFVPPAEAHVDRSLSAAPAGGSKADEKDQKKDAAAEAPRGMAATVYRKLPDGGLQALPVRVGASDGDWYELLAGNLKAGDAVVTGAPPTLAEIAAAAKADN